MKTQLITLRMVREKSVQYEKPVTCGEESYKVISPFYKDLPHESFYVMGTDTKNKITMIQEVARGSTDRCAFSPSDAMRALLLSNSTGAIFSHNHPSGDPTPSQDDKNLTQRLKVSCALLGIRFLDHLVIGDGKFYSFAINDFKIMEEKGPCIICGDYDGSHSEECMNL